MIEGITPVVDGGRFAAKRIVGDAVAVEADVFADGHDAVAAALLWRPPAGDWQEQRMTAAGNDRYVGHFDAANIGRYHFFITAWVDRFESWRRELARRPDDDPDWPSALAVGRDLIEAARRESRHREDRVLLEAALGALSNAPTPGAQRTVVLDETLSVVMQRQGARDHSARSDELAVRVERPRAGYGAWYEFFPRSCGHNGHGRLRDCLPMLRYVASMGFQVVYLPPISPIGHTHRKGANNTPVAEEGDVGSPWAIGSEEGGHTAIEPALGTLADFHWFMREAAALDLEVALDLAFQCSPDHPYVREHPEWFRHRPDGSIQYAENPPKKYQDIYPLHFECADWQALWQELKSVVVFWIEQGVRIFRADNPHTKPFAFWEWLIEEITGQYPDVLFLSEAFTRPKVMNRLCKLGFTYSYTYFTWRVSRHELTQYFQELTTPPMRNFFRPHVWPNTPDILPEYLQGAGRGAFALRFVLAATLAANYGIYGPAFELLDCEPLVLGKEEYKDSEKYQLRRWDIHKHDSLQALIQRVNTIRDTHVALQSDESLRFHETTNEQLLCYSKKPAGGTGRAMLMIVNLDPYHRQSGKVHFPLEDAGFSRGEAAQMHDLLSDARYIWIGADHYVELDPAVAPGHIFELKRRARTEHHFDYYA
ncbi:MAG: alpha-1,4-glucan--maltose-1-phosphate maltosyltransferase [Gammaproteobacteria bacterium]|nr:alpha-1,4-glucan--maltose-1-phosphate maltosyltransferase [Gammaproteobacteria bacterium]